MAKQQYPIIPLGDRVLVELVSDNKSEGGLHLPTSKVIYAIIRAIGKSVNKDLLYSDSDNAISRGLKVNDKVFLPRGDSVGEKFSSDEANFLLIPASYIAGILP